MITYLQLLDTPQEKKAFTVLYEKYHRQLYNRAIHLMKDSAAAEDLVHDTFLRVTKNMDKIMEADHLKNWYQTAVFCKESGWICFWRYEKSEVHQIQ